MQKEVVKAGGIKGIMSNDSIKKRFNEILGEKAPAFISSVINLVNSDIKLQNVNPQSIFGAAVVAATLDLPVDKNLGFSWIVPYGQKAQFQIGWKGFVQLAMRTGQYERINVTPVYEGQYVKSDPLTGDFEFDWDNKKSEKITHYAAYFRLINGFEKSLIMTVEEVEAHGRRYSKTFNNGPWKTDRSKMAMKTVLKLLLSRYGILSTKMQVATNSDQAAIKNGAYEYVDNGNEPFIDVETDLAGEIKQKDGGPSAKTTEENAKDEKPDNNKSDGLTLQDVYDEYGTVVDNALKKAGKKRSDFADKDAGTLADMCLEYLDKEGE
jgi:recombination protein RecT